MSLAYLDDLQRQCHQWKKRNFPDSHAEEQFLGVVEEVGELAHARLKIKQKIRGTESELREKEVDAIGDIVIYLMNYCSERDILLSRAIEATWVTVKHRDWLRNRRDGNAE